MQVAGTMLRAMTTYWSNAPVSMTDQLAATVLLCVMLMWTHLRRTPCGVTGRP